MESFGEYLKSLREERGISLDTLSERTKIAVANLKFLETDRYDLLPPLVFVKGFIRSYVNEVGLDPEEILKEFEAFAKEGELNDYEIEEHRLFHQEPPLRSFIGSTFFTTALTAAGILALGILLVTGVTRLFYWDNGPGSRKPSVTGVEAPGYGASVNNGPVREGYHRSVFSEPPRTQAGRKILEIKAISNAWVRVDSDSGPAEEMIMAPGDVQIFTAKERFNLQTGNAGGIRLRFDGRELPAMGKENQSLSLSLP